MPGYIMHLAEAQIILEKIRRIKSSEDCSDEWAHQFICGVLLPDAADKFQKANSHFWNPEDIGNIMVSPCLSRFLNQYETTWKTPLLCGYLAHLHLDKLYFGNYLCSQVDFLGVNGEREEKLKKVKWVFIKKNETIVTVADFFSEKYLYGDYSKLNYFLIQHYHVQVPTFDDQLDDFVSEVPIGNLNQVLFKLQQFLQKDENGDNELQIFHSESILEFLQESANEFIKIMDSL